jgi:hypothetical protein
MRYRDGMNPLGQMADTGAGAVLRLASDLITERGMAKGVTRDISTGRLDVLGAIALAAGAKVKDLDDRPDLLSVAVPLARRAAAFVAWEALEWVCDDDPVSWQDRHSLDDVVRALDVAATRLEIAVR